MEEELRNHRSKAPGAPSFILALGGCMDGINRRDIGQVKESFGRFWDCLSSDQSNQYENKSLKLSKIKDGASDWDTSYDPSAYHSAYSGGSLKSAMKKDIRQTQRRKTLRFGADWDSEEDASVGSSILTRDTIKYEEIRQQRFKDEAGGHFVDDDTIATEDDIGSVIRRIGSRNIAFAARVEDVKDSQSCSTGGNEEVLSSVGTTPSVEREERRQRKFCEETGGHFFDDDTIATNDETGSVIRRIGSRNIAFAAKVEGSKRDPPAGNMGVRQIREGAQSAQRPTRRTRMKKTRRPLQTPIQLLDTLTEGDESEDAREDCESSRIRARRSRSRSQSREPCARRGNSHSSDQKVPSSHRRPFFGKARDPPPTNESRDVDDETSRTTHSRSTADRKGSFHRMSLFGKRSQSSAEDERETNFEMSRQSSQQSRMSNRMGPSQKRSLFGRKSREAQSSNSNRDSSYDMSRHSSSRSKSGASKSSDESGSTHSKNRIFGTKNRSISRRGRSLSNTREDKRKGNKGHVRDSARNLPQRSKKLFMTQSRALRLAAE